MDKDIKKYILKGFELKDRKIFSRIKVKIFFSLKEICHPYLNLWKDIEYYHLA